MASPTVAAFNAAGSYPSGLAANDLLILAQYIEPANEASGTATYGTVTPPAGFASWPGSPVGSNDANILTQNTNRLYLAYKWATGSESGAVAWTVGGGDFTGPGTAVIAVRGATDTTGGHSGTPNMVQNSATDNGSTTTTTFPSVSVAAPALSLALLWLVSWDAAVPFPDPPTGWTDIYNQGPPFACQQTVTTAATLTEAVPFGSEAQPHISWLIALSAATGSPNTSNFFMGG